MVNLHEIAFVQPWSYDPLLYRWLAELYLFSCPDETQWLWISLYAASKTSSKGWRVQHIIAQSLRHMVISLFGDFSSTSFFYIIGSTIVKLTTMPEIWDCDELPGRTSPWRYTLARWYLHVFIHCTRYVPINDHLASMLRRPFVFSSTHALTTATASSPVFQSMYLIVCKNCETLLVWNVDYANSTM